MKSRWKIMGLLSLMACLSLPVAANVIEDTVCTVICLVLGAFTTIGSTFVTLMFIYGGLTYVYSADNPGGRKKGRDICIHAIIGAILVVLAGEAVKIVGMKAGGCGAPGC